MARLVMAARSVDEEAESLGREPEAMRKVLAAALELDREDLDAHVPGETGRPS